MPSREGSAAKNSVIGGAAIWTLKGHKDEDYKAVAAFYNFLARLDTQVWWHQATGYVPVTRAAYDAAKSQGYYKESPTREIAVEQLMRGDADRQLARLPARQQRPGEHRHQGGDPWPGSLARSRSQKAMDDAVERGNEVLRQFEKVNAGRN